MADPAHLHLQRNYFDAADAPRFHWQTTHPLVSRREAELAGQVRLGVGERLLEIGCGEGANLRHLRAAQAHQFGVDFSPARAAFARRATAAKIAVADATALPFASGSFDAVLIRDLLHHVPDAGAVLAETRRVLRRGGRLTLIEPNRSSPLVLLQATLIPAERGVLRSSARRLRALLSSAGLNITGQTSIHPLPLERLFCHPDFGSPKLASLPGAERLFHFADRMARHLIPQRGWMYLVFAARAPE